MAKMQVRKRSVRGGGLKRALVVSLGVHGVIVATYSVSDLQVVSSTGGFRFRAAAMEAVELAARARGFGPLPSTYPVDRLVVTFSFRPAR